MLSGIFAKKFFAFSLDNFLFISKLPARAKHNYCFFIL